MQIEGLTGQRKPLSRSIDRQSGAGMSRERFAVPPRARDGMDRVAHMEVMRHGAGNGSPNFTAQGWEVAVKGQMQDSDRIIDRKWKCYSHIDGS